MNTWVGNSAKGASAQDGSTYDILVNSVTADFNGACHIVSWLGFAFDADAGKVWINNNGTWASSAPPGADVWSGLTGGLWYPSCSLDDTSSTAVANFGASAFQFPVPSGFNSGIYE
jgi:hypothetical protein